MYVRDAPPVEATTMLIVFSPVPRLTAAVAGPPFTVTVDEASSGVGVTVTLLVPRGTVALYSVVVDTKDGLMVADGVIESPESATLSSSADTETTAVRSPLPL